MPEDEERNTVVVIPSSEYEVYSSLLQSYQNKHKKDCHKKATLDSSSEISVIEPQHHGAVSQTPSHDSSQSPVGHDMGTGQTGQEDEAKRPQKGSPAPAEIPSSTRSIPPKQTLSDVWACFDEAQKQIPKRFGSNYKQFTKMVRKSKRLQKQLGKFDSKSLTRILVRHFNQRYKKAQDCDLKFQKIFRRSDLKYLFSTKSELNNHRWWSLSPADHNHHYL